MWSRLKYFFCSDSKSTKIEREDLTAFDSENKLYPNSYISLAKLTEETKRAEVFEPAFKQFSKAFRIVEPRILNEASAREWHAARMQIIRYLLDVVNASSWKDNLVLRGSLLLTAWLGDAARIPNDIDWVVTPKNISPNDSSTTRFFEHLTTVVSTNKNIGKAIIEVDGISIDDIWTYERAQGKRIVFPWRVDGLPVGSIQMDFVFDEDLWCDPEKVEIPIGDGDKIMINAVSKGLSLAWKLMWLETDSYPQGKDLYDATMLAEQTFVSIELISEMIRLSLGSNEKKINKPDFPLSWQINDWNEFKIENPSIKGEAMDWQIRLKEAIARNF